MFNVYKNQWWNAPKEQIFEAYYMTLRIHYHMPALEAFELAKKEFTTNRRFMFNPIQTIQRSIDHVNS